MYQAAKHIENNFEIIELKSPSVHAKIAVNLGNMLFSLKKHSKELLYFPYSPEAYRSNAKLAGNPFMHPWANRLEHDGILVEGAPYLFPEAQKDLLYKDGNDLPLHGLLLKSDKWKTLEIFEDSASCHHLAELDFGDEKALSIFPYRHKIRMKHELKEERLIIETTLINLDEKNMPVSFGFHPYFLVDPASRSGCTLTVPATEVITTDEKMIPQGEAGLKENKWDFIHDRIALDKLSFDHGFQHLKRGEDGKAIFKLNDIEVIFDEHYAFAQLYAPDAADKPYVCIEPMTAATNALNRDTCRTIRKNESFSAVFSI